MQYSVRRGSSGWAPVARLTGRAFVLATLAGVAVLLFSGTASAETCRTTCEDASDSASRTHLGSALNTMNGLVQQPVGQLLGQGHGAAATTSSDTPKPVPTKQTVPAAASEDTTEDLVQQATEADATPTTLAASPPSLDVAEPVVSTVTDTGEAVVPVADTVDTSARDLLEGQPLQDAVHATTDAIAELGAAAVPAVAGTVQTLEATAQQLLDTARVTTTTLLDSAQQVVTTAALTLQPVTISVTGALATALGGPAAAGSAPSAEPGSGGKHVGAATLGDTLPLTGTAFANVWQDLTGSPASADGQVQTPPPQQISDEVSAADGDESAPVLPGRHAAPVPASGAANGSGTSSPSVTDLGKVFFNLIPAAPQHGFVPALHHSVHVPSAPVVESAQSPD